MPDPVADLRLNAADVTRLRHAEWHEHALRWRWLLDSWEGGQRYREAEYGRDAYGYPVRNLIRHKREYPESTACRADQYAPAAEDDDYALRLARTPVPTFLRESVDSYLSKIYKTEVDRECPESPGYAPLADWWLDADGLGATADEWMAETVAPLLVVLGQLDVLFDRPPAPEGDEVASRADAERLRINRVVASYILPENMLWWRLDPTGGRYAECLVREYVEQSAEDALAGVTPARYDGRDEAVLSHEVRYRHWTDRDWTLYDFDGVQIADGKHPYGRVPIVRVFDRRKPRCRNVGHARFESIAERQREYYNRDSELILSDTTQAHPLLQGPEDYVSDDGSIPIGPAWLLPKKKTMAGTSVTYEGFDVVDFPKGTSESLRANKQDIRDDVDRDARLVKPAGQPGTTGQTVAQSGVSKQFDFDGLHNALSDVSRALKRAETRFAEMALLVGHDGNPPAGLMDDVEVAYPTVFSLASAEEILTVASNFQVVLGGSGNAPEAEIAMLTEAVRQALPGRDDDTYAAYDDGIEKTVRANALKPDPEPVPNPQDPNAQPDPAATDTTPVETED